MQSMTVAATVPGGQPMQVEINGMAMMVDVPPGIQPGQQFTFTVAAPEKQPMPIAVAQPIAMAPQPVIATPVMPQAVMPVMMQPVMAQPAVNVVHMPPQQHIVVQGGMAVQGGGAIPRGSAPPPGAPPGGTWISQPFCGDQTCIATIVVALLFWPATCCIPCCKCDQRTVYRAPNNQTYLPNGALAPDDCCPCE